MTEVLTSQVTSLPEFNGNLSYWREDAVDLQMALLYPQGYVFEARLPQVIGSLTPEEREVFVNIKSGDDQPLEFREDVPKELVALFPDSGEKILSDAALVSRGLALLRYIEIESKHTDKGSSPRGSSFHTDDFVSTVQQTLLPTYLISSSNTTEFYSGPVRFVEGGNHLYIQEDSLTVTSDNVTHAKPFDIVRLSCATVHRSPKFKEAAFRTFLRIVPKVDPRFTGRIVSH